MTGGQMAPTTMLGQETTTTPGGRQQKRAGYPFRVTEFLSTLEGVAYATRVSLSSPANVIKAKHAIKTAFQAQLDGKGLSLVEILSNCPTQWVMTPLQSMEHVDKVMTAYYPLGEFKNTLG
jgi:2-oxoglutarate ferredoxin oxidoreductase subunit beta